MVPERYRKHVADLGEGLFVGDCYSTRPCIIKALGINSVFFITINPFPLVEGVEYNSVEIDDSPNSADELFGEILPKILPNINKLLEEGRNVLICCNAGKSRSVTITAAYLMSYKSMEMKQALDHIAARRKGINPNPGFVQALIRYENF